MKTKDKNKMHFTLTLQNFFNEKLLQTYAGEIILKKLRTLKMIFL